MDAERWQRLSPLLDVLLELEPRARAARLQLLRTQDPNLGSDLDRLLALEARDDARLDRPLHDPACPPLRGERIGPYRMDSLLGEGGMGMVWLASRADGLYQRQVALKLLRPGLADPNLRPRFTREREILARLAHPNIARLLDAGIGSEGQPYLALEYVEGIPITDHCQSNALSVEARITLFLQVCEAVSHAHANLIVHRDLKPSNILVTAAGQVRLLDFGIAKLLDDPEPASAQASTEARAFTLHYAAPEQVRGEPVSTRTDVYSLGVVLYELLAEAKPYRLRRQTDAEWEQAILAVEPLKPSLACQRGGDGGQDHSLAARRQARRLRGDLDTIALKALAKAPGDRYPSVEALALDLRLHLEGRPIAARPRSFAYRIGKYAVRQRWALGAGTLGIGLLVAAMAASVWQGRQAVREAARAQALQDFVIGLFDNAGAAQQGNIFDARALLLTGERRGERELASQPLAHAELLGVIARLRIGLGDYGPALALLDRQRGLLSRQRSVPPGLALDSVTQRGRTLRLLDRPRECIEAMAPAESMASRLGSRSPAREAEFLSQYGRCQRLVGNHARARPLYQRSLALRRSLRDQAGVAENLFDMALLDNDLGRASAAMNGFEEALAHLRRHMAGPHALAAEIQTSRARLHRARGDSEAAMAALRDALAIAAEIHGSGHPSSLSIQRQLLAMQVDAGEFATADGQIGPLLQSTLQSLGPRHREAAMAWNTRGVIAWELGRLEQAMDDTARAVDIWRSPDGSQNLHGGLFVRGMVLHAAGHYPQALAALRESRALRVAQFGASHALVGETDRMIGEVLAAMGEHVLAANHFDRAAKLTRIGYGQDHPRSLDAALSQARHLARTGRAKAALPRLDAMAVQPGGGSEIPKLRWSARAYAAEARCLSGTRARGRAELDALLRELARARPDGGTLVREIRSLREACAGQA